MYRRGRSKAELVLSKTEHKELTALKLRRKTAQALALRVRIVLACADGQDNKAIAARERVTPQMVSKWRVRFVEHRIDALLDALLSAAPRTTDDARVDAVIARTLESEPLGATYWSSRPMVSAAGLSQTAVSRIWRVFGSQLQWLETLKLSIDQKPPTVFWCASRLCSAGKWLQLDALEGQGRHAPRPISALVDYLLRIVVVVAIPLVAVRWAFARWSAWLRWPRCWAATSIVRRWPSRAARSPQGRLG